ncbi:universal stress protein [Zeaxanthinibacter sp. PT1]|uniref:universal stress protein n=1 Tax=Zeaxanthinibacter TaxID=561554 RepID=UPI002349E155|nr:universal stress protein [Zeaxanthinibacter sp. PT1]MDC6352106.1 universal stress protein [Zeaxanthinibacter sp. PT1]
MKTVLIPTDFSTNAWNAIAYVLQLFKNDEVKFYLLHTYTPAFYRVDYFLGGPEFSAIPDVGVERSIAGLEKTLTQISQQYPNKKHKFETISAFNTLTDEVRDQCKAKEIELIVMGTQGASGAKQLFLGSSTVFVIRKSSIPVLAIPENCSFKEIGNILLPHDYLSCCDAIDLEPLVFFAKHQKAKINVLHVKAASDLTEQQLKNKAQLKEHLSDLPHLFTELHGESMPNAILDQADSDDFQLLVMLNRKHSFFEKILIRQYVDQVGFHVKIPFLIIRDTTEKYS